MTEITQRGWTLAIVSIGLFMVVLDNLVVNVALPSIHRDLGASIQALEWTVNAYVLSYAVLLLTGAALGDRFGRKRMFMAGIALFTLSSAARGARSVDRLVDRRPRDPGSRRGDRDAADPDAARRRVSACAAWRRTRSLVGHQRHRRRARPAGRRGRRPGRLLALDLLDQRADRPRAGAACGPPTDREPRAQRHLDLPGLALGSSGLFGLVFGLGALPVAGLDQPGVLVLLIAGALLVLAFIVLERRDRAADAADVLLRQPRLRGHQRRLAGDVLRDVRLDLLPEPVPPDVLGNSPLQAGVKLLVWTGATMVVSPLAGFFSERYGSRPFMVAGLTLQAAALGWIASKRARP